MMKAAALSPFVFPPPTYSCLDFGNWEEGVNSAKAGSKMLQGSGGCAAAAPPPAAADTRRSSLEVLPVGVVVKSTGVKFAQELLNIFTGVHGTCHPPAAAAAACTGCSP